MLGVDAALCRRIPIIRSLAGTFPGSAVENWRDRERPARAYAVSRPLRRAPDLVRSKVHPHRNRLDPGSNRPHAAMQRLSAPNGSCHLACWHQAANNKEAAVRAAPIHERRTNSNLPQNSSADQAGNARPHSRGRTGNKGLNASNNNLGSKLRKGRRDRLASVLE